MFIWDEYPPLFRRYLYRREKAASMFGTGRMVSHHDPSAGD
jgi:hypothetical protein